jgi:CRP/FNR family cyclic AMP-dependent transcriptional regulator
LETASALIFMKALETSIVEHPFLKGMSAEYVKILTDSAMRAEFKESEIIFREGDPANRFYLIEEGRVVLGSHKPDSKPVEIQTIGAGDVLGWSWLFPPYYWNFEARALEPSRAIFFYGTRLREKCEEDRAFGYELMKRMSAVMLQRLQATRKQLLESEAGR